MHAEKATIDPVKPISKHKTEKLVARDVILKKLLGVSARDKSSAIVSKHYFHEALLNEDQEEEKKDDEKNSSSQLATKSESNGSKVPLSTEKRLKSEDSDTIPVSRKRKIAATEMIVKNETRKADAASHDQ